VTLEQIAARFREASPSDYPGHPDSPGAVEHRPDHAEAVIPYLHALADFIDAVKDDEHGVGFLSGIVSAAATAVYEAIYEEPAQTTAQAIADALDALTDEELSLLDPEEWA
jgi:hypothetical protein